MRDADVIVAVDGAAVDNLFFVRDGTGLVLIGREPDSFISDLWSKQALFPPPAPRLSKLRDHPGVYPDRVKNLQVWTEAFGLVVDVLETTAGRGYWQEEMEVARAVVRIVKGQRRMGKGI
jgi:hypothetical protein